MAQYTLEGKLAYSRGIRETTDIATIRAMLPGCQDITKTTITQDRAGIDYVATLRGGAQVLIDAKTREPGASRWWTGEPELALEIWSVMPGGRYNVPRECAKAGWTLSERTSVDLILYTFDPQDSGAAFLLSFQLLRTAFVRNFAFWTTERYKVGRQDSLSWESTAVFVPVSVVLAAITSACCAMSVPA